MAAALFVSPVAADPLVHDGESPPALAWRAAMEAGDAAAMARMYDGASVTFPPRQAQVVGRSAIVAGYADLFDHFRVAVSVTDAHWVEQPPLIVSWGVTTLTLHPKGGGAAITSRARFTDAAVARNGGWVYVIDHASVVPGSK